MTSAEEISNASARRAWALAAKPMHELDPAAAGLRGGAGARGAAEMRVRPCRAVERLRLHGPDDAGEPLRPASRSRADGGSEREDLPFSVDVWAPGGGVERVVAVAAHPGIAFAAYYAAAREFQGRRSRSATRGASSVAGRPAVRLAEPARAWDNA